MTKSQGGGVFEVQGRCFLWVMTPDLTQFNSHKDKGDMNFYYERPLFLYCRPTESINLQYMQEPISTNCFKKLSVFLGNDSFWVKMLNFREWQYLS